MRHRKNCDVISYLRLVVRKFPVFCRSSIRDSRISRRSLERQEVLFRRSPVGWRRREDTPPYRRWRPSARLTTERHPPLRRMATPEDRCQRSNSAVSRRTPRIIAKPPRWNQARRFRSAGYSRRARPPAAEIVTIPSSQTRRRRLPCHHAKSEQGHRCAPA